MRRFVIGGVLGVFVLSVVLVSLRRFGDRLGQ